MESEHFSPKAFEVILVQAKARTSSVPGVPQMLLPPVSWGAFEPVQHPGEIVFCSAWKLWATAATGHLLILGTFVAKTQRHKDTKTQRHKQIQREHVRTAFLRSDFFQDLSSTCLPRPPVQMMLKLRQLRSTSLSCPSMPTV